MSVIITPEGYQESHDIQDLTVKSTLVNQNLQSHQATPRPEDQHKSTDYNIVTEYVGLQCPQCGAVPNNTSARLVHDSCGHLKCRMCLLKEEDSCMTCEGQQKIGMLEAYMDDREVQN
ncbi:hypothetical protein B566_EDAN017021, partial [Ephemera danica]